MRILRNDLITDFFGTIVGYVNQANDVIRNTLAPYVAWVGEKNIPIITPFLQAILVDYPLVGILGLIGLILIVYALTGSRKEKTMKKASAVKDKVVAAKEVITKVVTKTVKRKG
jgi:hypothetical protein